MTTSQFRSTKRDANVCEQGINSSCKANGAFTAKPLPPTPLSTRLTVPVAFKYRGCKLFLSNGGSVTSRVTLAPTGGRASQITNAPAVLISRVRPTLVWFSQRKMTGSGDRKRIVLLCSTDPPNEREFAGFADLL